MDLLVAWWKTFSITFLILKFVTVQKIEKKFKAESKSLWKLSFLTADYSLITSTVPGCLPTKVSLTDITNIFQSFAWNLAGLLMGDDIQTRGSTGSDYRAALPWLSENQNKQP